MEAATTGGIELAVVRRFVEAAVDALAAAREEIDALNVFPIPDADTGTNLFLTMSAARDAVTEAVEAADDPTAATALAALQRGAMLGARGNSGAILSQMLAGLAARIARATPDERHAVTVAAAMAEATDASYAAVATPVEGTMLTVARAAADAAVRRAEEPAARARDVFEAAASAARDALTHTPEQLDVLREAGVVDAGGRGLTVVLDAAESVLTGRRTRARQYSHHDLGAPAIPRANPRPETPHLGPHGPSYEVMYLLEAEADAVTRLRATLSSLGDSLVVVGGEGLWNVHVHVDDVGPAIEAGIEAGRPYRLRVTHFTDQGVRTPMVTAREGRAIVAVAAGAGLAELFRGAGAVVIESAPGRHPTPAEVLTAVADTGAAEVVVLPNDQATRRAAQAAARTAEADLGVRIAVIPTEAQVQGLAALAVHEPARSFDADVLEMTATARHARHGAVTIATTRAITMAGPCEPGDVLGVVAGDFALVGSDLADVATGVLERLLGGGGELVTLVGGNGSDGLAASCESYLADRYAHVDVVVYDGGQDRYPLLMSVE